MRREGAPELGLAVSPGAKVLLDNLPGYPDNLMRGRDGRIWVGLFKPRNPAADSLSHFAAPFTEFSFAAGLSAPSAVVRALGRRLCRPKRRAAVEIRSTGGGDRSLGACLPSDRSRLFAQARCVRESIFLSARLGRSLRSLCPL